VLELFHISDLHFGKSKKMNAQSETLLREINKKFDIKTMPNRYLLVTGDITQSGGVEHYKIALDALTPFKQKIFFVPGNHDYGDIGFVYSEKRAKYFDDVFADQLDKEQKYFKKKPFIKVLPENDKNQIILIGLNSCFKRPVTKPLGGSLGLIGYHQMLELDKFLDTPEAKKGPKIAFLHHIPHKPAKDYWMDLLDWDEFMGIVLDRVDILAFGHEGSMEKPKGETKISTARTMKVRSAPAKGIEYILDANDSVTEQACYHIMIEDSSIAEVIKEKF